MCGRTPVREGSCDLGVSQGKADFVDADSVKSRVIRTQTAKVSLLSGEGSLEKGIEAGVSRYLNNVYLIEVNSGERVGQTPGRTKRPGAARCFRG